MTPREKTARVGACRVLWGFSLAGAQSWCDTVSTAVTRSVHSSKDDVSGIDHALQLQNGVSGILLQRCSRAPALTVAVRPHLCLEHHGGAHVKHGAHAQIGDVGLLVGQHDAGGSGVGERKQGGQQASMRERERWVASFVRKSMEVTKFEQST